MTRRGWLLSVVVGFWAATLPGCASRGQSVIPSEVVTPQSSARTATALDPDSASAQIGVQRQIDQKTVAPIGAITSDFTPPTAQVSKGRTLDIQKTDPPPGFRVPDFKDPPSPLPQLTLQPPTPPSTIPLKELWPSTLGLGQPPPNPPSADEPIAQAFNALARNQPAEAIELLKGFDEPTRMYVMRHLATLANIKDKSIAKLTSAELTALQREAEGIQGDLQSRSEFSIEKMCFCEKIDGYGQFKPLSANQVFQARTRFQIYVELRNIDCVFRDPYYVTSLHGVITIRNEKGEQVGIYNYRGGNEQQLHSIMRHFDCSRAYDYILGEMPPGRYTLTLEITDESRIPHRIAHKTLDFTVGPPAR